MRLAETIFLIFLLNVYFYSFKSCLSKIQVLILNVTKSFAFIILKTFYDLPNKITKWLLAKTSVLYEYLPVIHLN